MVAEGRARVALVFALGVLAAVPSAWFFWGFSVDDALIPARYAHHLALGQGYVMNAGGPVTDGVTPLGFPYGFRAFASAGPLAALAAARTAGLLAWLLGAGLVGITIDRIPGSRWRFLGLAMLAASAPLGAWASAGLETPWATLLVCAALLFRSFERDLAASACLGLAAWLRPELLPFSLLLSFPANPRSSAPSAASLDEPLPLRTIGARHFARLALAAAPFVVAALVRVAVFGRAEPLSVIAKPPSAVAGLAYSLACFLLTGPIALAAPLAWKRLVGWPRWLVGAVVVHYVAIALAGGDWMPLSRLCVAALPVVVVAAAYVAGESSIFFTAGRMLVVLTGELFALQRSSISAPRVMADRLALIEQGRVAFAGAQVIATEDAGWVGAATDATVVDLAGVTDPFVAALPGSHTDKRIPDTFLDQRHVDLIVFQLADGYDLAEPWWSSHFARGVERYVATSPEVEEAFEPSTVTVGRLRYVVLRRSPGRVVAIPSKGHIVSTAR